MWGVSPHFLVCDSLKYHKDIMYVDATFSKNDNKVYVVERLSNGKRHFIDYPVTYQFFVPDSKGKFRSIFDEPLARVTAKSYGDFQKELRIHGHKKLYESDLNQTYVCLSENYLHADPPSLNICFFDIETDFDPERGFSSPADAFMPITAISLYLQWIDTLICLAVPPKTLTMDEAYALVADLPNTILFETEAELLDYFLQVIEDADVLSGWNSTGYDIPYTVNRVKKVLPKDAINRFCLWGEITQTKRI